MSYKNGKYNKVCLRFLNDSELANDKAYEAQSATTRCYTALAYAESAMILNFFIY